MYLEEKLLSLTLVNSLPTPCQEAGQKETIAIQYCVRPNHAVFGPIHLPHRRQNKARRLILSWEGSFPQKVDHLHILAIDSEFCVIAILAMQ